MSATNKPARRGFLALLSGTVALPAVTAAPFALAAVAPPAQPAPLLARESLKALLREYRKTFREWGAALAGDYDRDMTDEESRAYQDAAAAPCHAAIDAMIEAPVVSLEDIATKLRFLFEVVTDGDTGVDPDSWEGRIVSSILRDIDAAKIPTAVSAAFSPSTFSEFERRAAEQAQKGGAQ